MRSLIASALCIITIITGWMFFMNHSDRVITETVDLIEHTIYTSTTEEDWDIVDTGLSGLKDTWKKHRSEYMFFIDQATLFRIDTTLAQADAYIQARSRDQAMGELSSLKTQFLLLRQSESLTWGNII